MSRYFGTDGFRGEANMELTADHAFKIGRFLGAYYTEDDHEGKILIGKDTRRSSYMFEYALAAGITASGADGYLLHVTTTPSVSYVARTEDFDCGIMISASHNPFQDNGIKLISGTGEKISGELIEELEDYLDGKTGELPFATGVNIGKTVDHVVGRNRYIGHLISIVSHSFKDMRIGLDVANGSSWEMAKSIFNALGAKTYVIDNEPNGFNINQNCGSTHISTLKELVLDKKLDVGFAFDGDADRCIAVDELGNVINGDKILYILAKYMQEKGELSGNAIAATLMSNMGLAKSLAKHGIEVSVTDVGDRFVYERMLEKGYQLGGEKTGHIILSKYAMTGDGILTALKLAEVMLDKKKSLAELAEDFTEYPQVQKNLRVHDKNVVMEDADVLAHRDEIEKALGEEGRVVLRKSGTEPAVRIMIEAKDVETCNQYVSQLETCIRAKGYIEETRAASNDGIF